MKKKIILTIGAVLMICGIVTSQTYGVFQADGNDVQTHISTNTLDIELTGEGVNQVEVFEDLVPNQIIDKEMAVTNIKDATLYTRVIIHKYWLDKDGNKDFDADAKNIKLHYNQDDWLLEYEDNEDVVLYYKKPLVSQETTAHFLKSIQVPGDLNNDDMGRKFALDIQVDAVQYVDGVNAMLTHWGVLATLENDEIVKIER